MIFKRMLRKIVRIVKSISNKKEEVVVQPEVEVEVCEPFKILLLTNRDSDNVGDQTIEACDIGLLHAVMKNLGIEKNAYKINSKEASIVSKKYLKTKNDEDLEKAENLIKETDIIMFGGAPVFNYLYQAFYERTAITLELAQKHNVPVIFSAIGIESYHEDNEKCQRLKKTLNYDCVKMITTRDDFESLKKYIYNKNIKIAKVADPAVFSNAVFRDIIKKEEKEQKKIGLFIIRGNAFKDNGFSIIPREAALMWKGVVQELQNRGYDYELITSGHFSDEAFVDNLIKNYDFQSRKCIFNINSPDDLLPKLSNYDAIVSCRLHPSIIAFGLEIPSIGIVWNKKVKFFYESFGYGDRVISADEINPKLIVDKIETAITEGVTNNKEDLASVYNYLFSTFKSILKPDEEIEPFGYDELILNIPSYKPISEKEKNEKLKRKFRRMYDIYNNLNLKNRENQKEIKILKEKIQELEAKVNS